MRSGAGGEWVITGQQEGLPKKEVKGFGLSSLGTTFPAPPAVILGKDKKQALITKHLGS